MDEIVARLDGVSRIHEIDGGRTVAALEDFDLDVRSGGTVVVSGPSGSGKTTLLQILGLLDAPTAGRQTFLGRDVSRMAEPERAGMRAESVSFMFQENWLLPWLTSLENVLAPQVHLGRLQPRHEAKARDLLARLGLSRETDRFVPRLSGGQRQRVCLARALLKSPRLVVADEPSASLDSATTTEVLDLLLDLKAQEGFALVVATHDPIVMDALGSTTIHLRDGRKTA